MIREPKELVENDEAIDELYAWATEVADASNEQERQIADLAEKVGEQRASLGAQLELYGNLAERVEDNRQRLRHLDGGSNRDEGFVMGHNTKLAHRIERLEKHQHHHSMITGLTTPPRS